MTLVYKLGLPMSEDAMAAPAAKPAAQIETPVLDLHHCSVEEHCRSLIEHRRLPFWWYFGPPRAGGHYSLPFKDHQGRWWYQVKRGLCWPADFFQSVPADQCRLPLRVAFLGYQHILPDESHANSKLVINTIASLADYNAGQVDTKRRNAVRKGLRCCEVARLDKMEPETVQQCRDCWNQLTERTGWKSTRETEGFAASWKLLLGLPGVSILVGRNRETQRVAGFLIVKIIGLTAYVDTIASHSEMLGSNVNDVLIYSFLANARRLSGVVNAHFAIRSYVHSLEQFKTSMGFESTPFPAMTRLRWPVGSLLRLLAPAKFKRMIGQFDEQSPGRLDERVARRFGGVSKDL